MRVKDAEVKQMTGDAPAYRREAEFLDHGRHLQNSPGKLPADDPSQLGRLPGQSLDGCRVDFYHRRATHDLDPELHRVMKDRGQSVDPARPDVVQGYLTPVGHGHHGTQQAADQYSNPRGSVGRIKHLADAEGPVASGRLELGSRLGPQAGESRRQNGRDLRVPLAGNPSSLQHSALTIA